MVVLILGTELEQKKANCGICKIFNARKNYESTSAVDTSVLLVPGSDKLFETFEPSALFAGLDGASLDPLGIELKIM